MYWRQVSFFCSTDVNFATIVSQFSHGENISDISATVFPSLAKSMEHRIAILGKGLRPHIRCHASLYKNLDGNEMTFEKRFISVFNISTNQSVKNQIFTVNSLVSDHPWCTGKWSLTRGGRLREK